MAEEQDQLITQEAQKVLLAQFDPLERGYTRLFLQTVGGYKVLEAATGMDLVKLIKKRPDLILLDTVTQGHFIPALEIIRRISALNDIPIAVYSHEQNKLPECIKKGADGFIVKPSSPAAVLGKIWKLLGEESQRAASAAGFASKYKRDLQHIDNLPTLPTIYAEVDKLCKNPEIGADELSRVIETDPAISLKLLNLANSAFFGFSRQIKSVRDAISLLGNQTVRNTILNISVFEATKDLKDSAGLDKNAFWRHSAGVGSIAKFVSKKRGLDRQECFTAGIIHDMGKIIMDSLYREFYVDVIQKVEDDGGTLYDAEREIIGLHHGQIGRELCESWNLPTELISAVAFHHRPTASDSDSEIASLIHIGDVIARKLDIGSGGDTEILEAHPGALKRLDLAVEQLEEWEPEIRESIDRDQSILSILKH